MNVYRERAFLVAHLAACKPHHWIEDPAEPDWPVILIETEAGQMSWHISKDDLDLFPPKNPPPAGTEPTWDGHTTEEKYERLARLTALMARITEGNRVYMRADS